MKRLIGIAMGIVAIGVSPQIASAQGRVFITGHDPDFHAYLGGNAAGAININQIAIGYVMDASVNQYAFNGINKFLFVEANTGPWGGHTFGENGMISSGYVAGTDYEKHDASTLVGELAQLGTKYSAIVVASDFGGMLTQAELNILNGHVNDIQTFLQNTGGLYAMAESNNGAGNTPGGGQFDFLPIVNSSVPADQSESGFTVTAFGASLGLTNGDVNGNASHNVFSSWGSELSPVDLDAQGRVLSLAGEVTVVPEPATLAVLAGGLGLLARRRRK